MTGVQTCALPIYESGNGYDRDVQRWLGQISHDMLARFVKMGLVDGARVAAGARLEGHLDDYKAYLEHKGDTPAYAGKSVSRINGILAGCKFRTLNDIQCSKIQKFLADEIQAGRIGQKTANHYTRAIKTFFNWMVQDGRIDTNPVQHLRMLTVTLIKKDRRALTTDEIASLLGWLAEHGTTAYGLTAAQRRIVYLLGLTTGLRASEIASLTSSSIDFQGKTVTVKAAYTKNRQAAILPLRSDILALLQDYTAGMMPGVALFDIPHRTADMIRADLDGARLH